MSDQQIGVESIFGTRLFTKGLNTYLAGIADAVAKTGLAVAAVNAFQNNTIAALTQILGQAQGVATAVGLVTKAITAASGAAATAAAAPATAPVSTPGNPTLADELRQTQLINEEIRDQIALENLVIRSQDKQLSALQLIGQANELNRLQVLRDLRDEEAKQVQLNQLQLDNIRNTAATPRDTGKDARRELEDELRLNALLQSSLKARIAEETTKRTLLDANLTPLARERALIEQATQALEQQKRVQEALAISAAAAQRVRDVHTAPVSDADLGIKQRDPLADQVRVQQMISEEIRSQIKLKQAQILIDNAGTSALKKVQAETEKETLLLEQQKRARDITQFGGNTSQLDAVKAIQITLADLGQKQVDVLLNQVTLQRILSEEIRDRIGAEQARLTLMNAQSTVLQKQQAQINLSDIAARRAANTSTAQTLNIPGSAAAIANIRNATVATRDLGAEVKQTTRDFQGMSAGATAVAVTIGNLAASAIRNAIQAFTSLSSSILSNVADFENLDLSIQFFTARSAVAKDASLTFNEALGKTQEQSQALVFWLQQLAISSPFTTKEVGTLFRVSQAYGLTREEAEQLTPLMLDFAAASGLTGDVLERLALAFGQVRARGKLTGEEVRQLGNSGLPIRDILVKTLHIANDEFDELLESGALTSDVVLPAIINAMKDFQGQGERISFGTIKGIISAFQEFQEISSATFFRGLLDPLIDDFKEFFAVVNQPTTLAMIKLIGQELGGDLESAVHSLGAALQGLTQDWLALDPAIKQQILTFGAAFTVAILVVGAIGLLTAAFGLLTQPIVVAVTLFAFFVSEYSSNFAVLNHVTGGWLNTILDLPGIVARGIGGAVKGVGDAAKAIGDVFAKLISETGRWGAETVSNFAEGALGAIGAILPIFAEISSLFSFNLAPGSPPRVAPLIDIWGKHTMQEYADGLGAADFNKPFAIVSKKIEKGTQDLAGPWQKATDLLVSNASPWEKAVEKFGANISPWQKAVSHIANGVKDAAKKADFGAIGVEVSQDFVDGFMKGLPVLIPAMDAELRKLLDRIGSGAQLSAGGAFAMNQFLSGFKLADFSILDSASSTVEDILQSMVDLGQLDPLDLDRLLFSSNEGIAGALEEFRKSGSISQKTLDKLGSSAKGAGKFAVELLTQYQGLAKATDAADLAQKELNNVTEKYSKLLEPLQAQLDKINSKVTFNNEEERLASLRRLIANEGVSAFRKSNAQDEIAQILAERRVRTLEDQQKAATDAGKKTVDAATKKKDAEQEAFDLLQANINAQLKQLGLVAKEGSTLNDLQEEALKQREKQKTELELQLELTRFQNEEMADLTKAAKAKLVLEDSTSSEYAKQQAMLDLQEVAISRRNRLLEAAKFGIPEEELTKIRNLVPTMDDLGIKEGKEKFSSDLSAITDGLVDVKSITEQIETATEKVRKKWEEVKQQIIDTFTTMNENLPGFLKFLPDDKTGDIPIVGTLTKVGEGIAGLALVITSTKIIALISSIRNLLGFGKAAAGAKTGAELAAGLDATGVAAGGALASLLAVSLVLGSIVVAATALGLITGQAMADQNFLDRFEPPAGPETEDQKRRREATTKKFDPSDFLNPSGQLLPDLPGNPIRAQKKALIDSFLPTNQDKTDAQKIWQDFGHSLLDEMDPLKPRPEGVNDAAVNKQALINGLLPSPTEKASVQKTWQTFGADVLAGLDPLPASGVTTTINAALLQGVGSALGPETQAQIVSTVNAAVANGVKGGLDGSAIQAAVGDAVSQGITAGLLPNDPVVKLAADAYFAGLIRMLKESGEIDSPSKLSAREVGEPIGFGIPQGILDALTSKGTKDILSIALRTMLLSVGGTAEDVRAKLIEKFGAAQKDVLASSVAIREGVTSDFDLLLASLKVNSATTTLLLQTDWASSELAATNASEKIKTDVNADFIDLGALLIPAMAAIKKTVVDSFTLMQTDSITAVALLRTEVTDSLVGEKDSLLTDINLALLGPENTVPTTMGMTFMQALGAGIISGKENLAESMISAFSFALVTAGASLPTTLLPKVGVAGLRPQQQVNNPVGGVNSVRINNYYLTVNTGVSSQGVISDFGIMQTMAGS